MTNDPNKCKKCGADNRTLSEIIDDIKEIRGSDEEWDKIYWADGIDIISLEDIVNVCLKSEDLVPFPQAKSALKKLKVSIDELESIYFDIEIVVEMQNERVEDWFNTNKFRKRIDKVIENLAQINNKSSFFLEQHIIFDETLEHDK